MFVISILFNYEFSFFILKVCVVGAIFESFNSDKKMNIILIYKSHLLSMVQSFTINALPVVS